MTIMAFSMPPVGLLTLTTSIKVFPDGKFSLTFLLRLQCLSPFPNRVISGLLPLCISIKAWGIFAATKRYSWFNFLNKLQPFVQPKTLFRHWNSNQNQFSPQQQAVAKTEISLIEVAQKLLVAGFHRLAIFCAVNTINNSVEFIWMFFLLLDIRIWILRILRILRILSCPVFQTCWTIKAFGCLW